MFNTNAVLASPHRSAKRSLPCGLRLTFALSAVLATALLLTLQPAAVAGSDETKPSPAVFSPASEVIGKPRIKLQSGAITFVSGRAVSSARLAPELSSALPPSPTAVVYVLVQFGGPITEENKAALESCGAQVHEYIPDFAFLVGINSEAAGRLAEIKGVAGVAPYLPQYKMETTLLAEKIAPGLSSMLSGVGAETGLVNTPNTPLDLTIVGFKGESLSELTAALRALGASIVDSSETEHKLKVRAIVPSDRGADVANMPAVRWVEMTPEWKLTNNLAADNTEMDVRDVWNSHGLYGSGQIAAVADTGLDQGSILPAGLHNDFEDGSGASRVIAILDTAGDGNLSDTNGHGTHVAGSVLGNGFMSGSTPSTHIYPSTAFAGMAPEAQLVHQAVMNNSTGGLVLPADLNTLFNTARGYDAWVHTNSWGSADGGGYNSYSQDVDENVWNNKNFSILFSAGNEGVDADRDGLIDGYSMGAPGTAKNCITVGASENNRPSGAAYNFTWGYGWPQDYNANPIFSDHLSNNVNGMAAFSSRGPCIDGRRKPDIVAPGTNIVSVRSSVGGTGWGAYDANYSYNGGTSMSTPLTAGAAVLVRDFFARGNYPGITTPSAALIKAVLVSGATDMTPGQYISPQEIAVRPNNVEGWGRVGLEDSLFDIGSHRHTFIDNTSGLSTSGEVTYNVGIASSSQPLKVSLVWSDYWGSLSYGGGLVNDLDLNVIRPNSTVTYPNNASQRGPSRFISYTDLNVTYITQLAVGTGWAVKFTPSSYPYYLDATRMMVYNSTTTYSRYPFTINVYDDDGSGGNPGTVLRTANAYSVLGGSSLGTVTWPFSTVTITSGSFYIEFRAVTNSPRIVSTTVPPITTGNDFQYNGSSWAPYTNDGTRDIDIDAVGHNADYATSNDRVNNVEGIDIASPAAGRYQIRIQGYNIPSGPQPFAVVVSGDLDNTPPTISIGAPSASLTKSGPVTYAITYGGADTITLAPVHVTPLNKTGTADGTVAVEVTGNTTRTVRISNITGDGTLGISIAAGTASDTAGNTAPAAGPSATFAVYNPSGPGVVRGKSSGPVYVGGIVTAKFGTTSFYVENPDRSVGVKVMPCPTWVSEGDDVVVNGDVHVSGIDKHIDVSTPVVVLSSGNAKPELGMRMRDVGGHAYGPNDPGITNARGPLNVGLYVTIQGTVTYRDTTGLYPAFYVWDGTNMVKPMEDSKPLNDDNPDGHIGMRVAHNGWLGAPYNRALLQYQDFVTIKGIVGLDDTTVPGQVIPVILPVLITPETAFDNIASAPGVALNYMVDYGGANLVSIPGVPAKLGNGEDPAGGTNPYPWDPTVVFAGADQDIAWSGEASLFRWENANSSQYMYDVWAPDIFGGINPSDGYWMYLLLKPWALNISGKFCEIPQWYAVEYAGIVWVGQPHNYITQLANIEMSDGGTVYSFTDASQVDWGLQKNWVLSTGFWWNNQDGSQYDVDLAGNWPTNNCTFLSPWLGYLFTMQEGQKAWIIP